MNKPTCPSHPSGGVIAARKPGDDRLQWICLVCGAKLGDAGPRDGGDGWEKQTIDREATP